MSTRRAVQTPARPQRRPPDLSQSEHRELFDQLMRPESPGKDSPFARFALTDEQGNNELDYVVSVVDLIGSKIEQLRHDRQEDALSPSFASFKEKFARWHLATFPTQAAREDARFRLKWMFGFPITRGRPSTSHKRWPLIQQVYLAYPKGTVKLTQSGQRDNRTAVHASHFEQTVKVALDLAGDVIKDVHAECCAVVQALQEA